MLELKLWKLSWLNKILGVLWCGVLLRKGLMCCMINCLCFNDVESLEVLRVRVDEWVKNFI